MTEMRSWTPTELAAREMPERIALHLRIKSSQRGIGRGGADHAVAAEMVLRVRGLHFLARRNSPNASQPKGCNEATSSATTGTVYVDSGLYSQSIRLNRLNRVPRLSHRGSCRENRSISIGPTTSQMAVTSRTLS